MAKQEKSKRFVYNLKTLLWVREMRERQQQEKFNESQRKLAEELRKEEEIKEKQNQRYDELKALMSPGAVIENFHMVLVRQSHLEIMKVDVAAQVEETQKADTQMQEERERLIKAARETKIIDTDREHKKVAWKKMKDKADGKFLDEIATIGYERRRRQKAEENLETPKPPKLT